MDVFTLLLSTDLYHAICAKLYWVCPLICITPTTCNLKAVGDFARQTPPRQITSSPILTQTTGSQR
jgi:hypothetical protein